MSYMKTFSQQSQAVYDLLYLLLKYSFLEKVQEPVEKHSRSGSSSVSINDIFHGPHPYLGMHSAEWDSSTSGPHHRAGKGLWWFPATLRWYNIFKVLTHLKQEDVIMEVLNVEVNFFPKNYACFNRVTVKLIKT